MTGALATVALGLGLLLGRGVAQDGSAPLWEDQWRAGHREQSLAGLQAAAADDPSLRSLLAERLMAVHRYEAALALAYSQGGAGRSLQGRCLYVLGRYDEALLCLDPDAPLDTLMRVDALEVLGRMEELPAALDRAEDVLGSDHPALLTVRGRLAAGDGDDVRARDLFAAALRQDPLQQGARFGLGRSQLRLGQTREGTETLAEHRRLAPLIDQLDAARRGVDLAPRHAPSLAALGDAERDVGRLDAAEQAYRDAAEFATPSEVAVVALRHARLLAEDRGDREAAVALLDEAASKTPSDPRLLVRAGDLLAGDDLLDEAAERYRMALAVRPGDGQIARRLALVEGANR